MLGLGLGLNAKTFGFTLKRTALDLQAEALALALPQGLGKSGIRRIILLYKIALQSVTLSRPRL